MKLTAQGSCVAISLQRSHLFHDIDEQMLNRIDRFNKYLETYPDDFADVVMCPPGHRGMERTA